MDDRDFVGGCTHHDHSMDLAARQKLAGLVSLVGAGQRNKHCGDQAVGKWELQKHRYYSWEL